MKSLALLLFPLCFSFSFIFGQTMEKREEHFKDAEYFFKRGEYEESLYQYMQAMGDDTTNALLNFKIGETYLQIPGRETMAVPYLEKAAENIEFKVKFNSFEEKKAPLHTLFYLGNAYRLANEPGKALEVYAKFTDHPEYYDNYNLEIVENEIEAVERAKIIKDRPIEYEFINVGTPINTPARESDPVISGDGNTLVFVRELTFYNGVFLSTRTDSGWSEPVNITPQVGSDGEAYPTALNMDGTVLLLISNREGNSNIYNSTLNNGRWSRMKLLNGDINSRKDETSACLSTDGNELYFSTNRKSRNGFDIWRATLQNSEWTNPEPLSDVINTEMDETDPSLSKDGNILYFSSTGHYNMGMMDIFISEKENGSWKLPRNAGYPLNTTNNNIRFAPSRDGTGGYISKFVEGNFENEDIFYVKFP